MWAYTSQRTGTELVLRETKPELTFGPWVLEKELIYKNREETKMLDSF